MFVAARSDIELEFYTGQILNDHVDSKCPISYMSDNYLEIPEEHFSVQEMCKNRYL